MMADHKNRNEKEGKENYRKILGDRPPLTVGGAGPP